MTTPQEDIIGMAREAGLIPAFIASSKAPYFEIAKRFAELVAAHERELVIRDAIESGYIAGAHAKDFADSMRLKSLSP